MSALYVTPGSIRSEMDEAAQEYGLNPAQAEALAALDDDTISRAITPSDSLIGDMDRLQRAAIAKLSERPEVKNARSAPTYTQAANLRDAAARYVAARDVTASLGQAVAEGDAMGTVYALEVSAYGDSHEVDLVDQDGVTLQALDGSEGMDLHVALTPTAPILDLGEAPSGEVRPYLLVEDLPRVVAAAEADLVEALAELEG